MSDHKLRESTDESLDDFAFVEPDDVVSGDETHSGGGPGTRPPHLRTAVPPTGFQNISDDDQNFINQVFDQVKDVDFRSPPPPPAKGLTGLDQKMHALRDQVRKLERELARVGHIWRIKAHEIEAFDAIVDEKERERKAAIARWLHQKSQLETAVAQHRSDVDTLAQHLESLQHDSMELRGQMQTLEQEKAAMALDFKNNLDKAQVLFTQHKEKLITLEEQLRSRDEMLAFTRHELDNARHSIALRQKQVDDLSARLGSRDDRMMQMETAVADLHGKLEEAREQLYAKNDELARLRLDLETRVKK